MSDRFVLADWLASLSVAKQLKHLDMRGRRDLLDLFTKSAADYLDVISAQIDADRYATEASGERLGSIENATADGEKDITEAKVDAAKRVGKAVEESAEFVAVGQAYAVAPDAFELRLRGDIVKETLGERPLILMDKTFTIQPGEFFFDFRAPGDAANQVQGEK